MKKYTFHLRNGQKVIAKGTEFKIEQHAAYVMDGEDRVLTLYSSGEVVAMMEEAIDVDPDTFEGKMLQIDRYHLGSAVFDAMAVFDRYIDEHPALPKQA